MKMQFGSPFLMFLAACGGGSNDSQRPSSDSPMKPAELTNLTGRWIAQKVECLSDDDHLRPAMEIDLNSNFLAIIGTQSETDSKVCRSVLAYQRISTSISSDNNSRNESGSLSNGSGKVTCWAKPKNDGDAGTSIPQSTPNIDMTYSLQLTSSSLNVTIQGWPECKSLYIEATPKNKGRSFE